ncbi:MAG: DEDD exonuclease domain-containing protein [Egibacteraceae bacterium]
MVATQLPLPSGTPLHEVTFVVVDLETTGGSPASSRITEIGAVRVRAGEVDGELATLVDPEVAIPPGITALTGIDDAMVAGRPAIGGILPALLEFARGSVLVAHNARFDVGFLEAALRRSGRPPLEQQALCTAALARRLLGGEVRDCRLATLAAHVGARTRPEHRALADARATVDVLHALIERAGSVGATTLEDLSALQRVGSAPVFAARRRLADDLPRAPGVYAFTSAAGERLYVGTATDLRARVRSYFGADPRRRVPDLLRETARVERWVTPTAIEAEVAEARLIRREDPRYNRRGRPRRPVWLRLTAEAFPRLSIARTPPAGGQPALGPLGSRRQATALAEALHEAVPLRRCTQRLPRAPQQQGCALGELGRCAGPCTGTTQPAAYAERIAPAVDALRGDAAAVLATLSARMDALARAGRFEDAARLRDRTDALAAAVRATRERACLAASGALVAARPTATGGELVACRDGLLVASRSWDDSSGGLAAAEVALADAVAAAPGPPDPVAADVERRILARWLGRDGVVARSASGPLAEPVAGGAALAAMTARLAGARRDTGRPEAELASKRRRSVA